MENNITKILMKKIWKRCVTILLNSLQIGMTLPFWCSLSLTTFPKKKCTFPYSSAFFSLTEFIVCKKGMVSKVLPKSGNILADFVWW